MATSPNIMLSNNPAVVDGGTFGTQILGEGITINGGATGTNIVGGFTVNGGPIDIGPVAPSWQSIQINSTTVINTTVNTVATSGGKAYLQVFLSVGFTNSFTLMIEGVDFTVTGPNQITIAVSRANGTTISIFSFA